ncbi:restriction endonuclease subunit S, partial [bacterium]|nr:restriction endonuclease subunit S [bacterium]
FNLKKHGLIGGVPLKDLININFPLPPLAEQERIVNKLDNYISKLDEAKEKLEKVVDTYNYRKNLILHRAFTGQLTKNWRKENPNIESVEILLEKINQEKQNLTKKRQIRKDKDFINEEIPYEIPNTWKWIKLKNICTKIVDGSHNPPKGESEKTDYIMLSATNIKDDKFIDLDKVRYLSKENFDLENQRTNIQIGDICFTSVGSIGRSCIFKGGLNLCFQRSVSIITTPISSEYLKYFFDSSYFQNKVQFEARGSCQVGFYLNQLAISLIPLPPLEEQKEIVKILDSILSKEKQVKEIAEKEIERIEDLKKNLLTRAFGGVLGTNDPNEENSIELLKSVL